MLGESVLNQIDPAHVDAKNRVDVTGFSGEWVGKSRTAAPIDHATPSAMNIPTEIAARMAKVLEGGFTGFKRIAGAAGWIAAGSGDRSG